MSWLEVHSQYQALFQTLSHNISLVQILHCLLVQIQLLVQAKYLAKILKLDIYSPIIGTLW